MERYFHCSWPHQNAMSTSKGGGDATEENSAWKKCFTHWRWTVGKSLENCRGSRKSSPGACTYQTKPSCIVFWFTETALSCTGKCVSWTVGLISRYAMVYIHGNAPRQALSLGLGNQRTRKSTDSEINGLENQRTRELTDSGINRPGNQRTRKSTDSEINGLGNQQTRKSTDSEINGLGNKRARQKLA